MCHVQFCTRRKPLATCRGAEASQEFENSSNALGAEGGQLEHFGVVPLPRLQSQARSAALVLLAYAGLCVPRCKPLATCKGAEASQKFENSSNALSSSTDHTFQACAREEESRNIPRRHREFLAPAISCLGRQANNTTPAWGCPHV